MISSTITGTERVDGPRSTDHTRRPSDWRGASAVKRRCWRSMPHMAHWWDAELELSVVAGLLNNRVTGSGRKGWTIHANRSATTPSPSAIHCKGCLLLGALAQLS